MDIAAQLKMLAQLRDEGLLSPDEFEVQRRAVLAGSLSGNANTQGVVLAAVATSSIGAYDLMDLVGEGGMGAVYRGRHRVPAMAARQGGDVAVKLLHTHLAGKEGWAARFRREAEALAALDHPNIVRVFDVVEEPGRIGLVMEWVPGRPLSEVIGRETGPIPWERARAYVDPILSAMEHAHRRGVVHRDLKPDNIRITPEGTVKVLDFGIARLGESSSRTKTGTGMGTVDYMAPEQYADAKEVDARADVYALGMTLYEMVAGRLPWEPGETEFGVLQRKHSGEIPLPTDFYPTIPPWVVAAIMAALRPDPTERLESVDALRAALFEAPKGGKAAARKRPSEGVAAVKPKVARRSESSADPIGALSPFGEGQPLTPPARRGVRATAVVAGLGLLGLGAGLLALLVALAVWQASSSWESWQAEKAACARLMALRGELRQQKVNPLKNNDAVLRVIIDDSERSLMSCKTSPEGLGVHALARVWSQHWQLSGATMRRASFDALGAEVDSAAIAGSPEGLAARVVYQAAGCSLLDGDEARRVELCTRSHEHALRFTRDTPSSDLAWLRVEVAWADAMAGLAQVQRLVRDDPEGARSTSARMLQRCAVTDADLSAAAVNGPEMVETCMTIAGHAQQPAIWLLLADQLLRKLPTSSLPDNKTLTNLYQSAGPECARAQVGRDRLPWFKGQPVGDGGWADWCRVLGARGVGCGARALPPTRTVCTCCPGNSDSIGDCQNFYGDATGSCPYAYGYVCQPVSNTRVVREGVPWDALLLAPVPRTQCIL